eukprot:Lithocolla_globosa_v1_NODE_1383_length_2618_cov_3.822083.p1 type:complete len:396 gc:universal NODE_1383_length_2618_cov_3.822083:1193-6(-)
MERMGMNIFNSTDSLWHRKRRKLLAPSFSQSALRDMFVFMQKNVEVLCGKFETSLGEMFDISHEVKLFSVDVIGEVAFGESFNMLGKGDHLLLSALSKMLTRALIMSLLPEFMGIRAFGRKIFVEPSKEMVENFCQNVLQSRRSQIRENKKFSRNDILQKLVNLGDPSQLSGDETPVPDDEIIRDMIVFLIAGADTTALTIAYTLYLVFTHKKVEVKVVNEILQKLCKTKNPHNYQVTYDDLNELPYLNAVLNESMRLYPVASNGTSRRLTETIQLHGFKIEKGTDISISLHAPHHDALYWEQPDRFDPERFVSERKQGAFLPFSLGDRNCIGKMFALLEAKLTLVTVLLRYTGHISPTFVLRTKSPFLMEPVKGIPMTLERRKYIKDTVGWQQE